MVDEPAESSRLSPLRMTDEEDEVAAISELLDSGVTDTEGDTSSEHAANQTIETNVLEIASHKTKPSFVVNYFASGSSGWTRAITPTVARVALTKSAGATFNCKPRSPALT